MANDFNLLNGEVNDLIKHLEEQKKKVKKFESELTKEYTKTLKKQVEGSAHEIAGMFNGAETVSGDLNRTIHSVRNFNVIDEVSTNHHKLYNSTQEATYAEFGTGVIGSRTPYVKHDIGWEYDVNEHGEGGWLFMGDSGRLIRSKGYPAFSTYYNSFETTKQHIPSISKKVFRRVFTNEE